MHLCQAAPDNGVHRTGVQLGVLCPCHLGFGSVQETRRSDLLVSTRLDEWIYGPSFVHVFPLCLGSSTVMVLLHFCASRGCSVSPPEGSPLGPILADCSMPSDAPVTEKELVFCCNAAWSMDTLDDGGKRSPKVAHLCSQHNNLVSI